MLNNENKVTKELIKELARNRVYTDKEDLGAELDSRGIYLMKNELEEVYEEVKTEYGRMKRDSEPNSYLASESSSYEKLLKQLKGYKGSRKYKGEQNREGFMVVDMRDRGYTYQEIADAINK